MSSAGPSPLRKSAAAAGLGLTLLLAGLVWRLPPDGKDHAAFAQFLGRFHPLLVHLPIGLLLLVPLLELAGAFGRREDLRSAAGFVLVLATAGALAAALDGWLLAWSGGYSGPLVTRHMWGGTAFAALCLITVGVRAVFAPDRRGWPGFVFIYGPLLAAAVVLMTWTSHQGGQLSHGPTFLTEFMPAPLRTWLDVPEPAKPKPAAPPTGEPTLYATRIAPILARSCVSCHNPHKVKGGLRMDTYDELMRGGTDGPVITPWHPADSEIVRRITLDSDDDDFMPSNGKNLLTPDEIKLIEQWIAAGASAAEPAHLP